MPSFCFVLEERCVATQTLFSREYADVQYGREKKGQEVRNRKDYSSSKTNYFERTLFLKKEKSCFLDKIFYEPYEIVLLNQKAMCCVDGRQSYRSNWSALKKKSASGVCCFFFIIITLTKKIKSTLRMTFYLDKANTTSVSN